MKRNISISSQNQGENWICIICTYNNHPSIFSCEMCSTDRPKQNLPPKMDEQSIPKKRSADFQCHKCSFGMQKLLRKCPKCQQILMPLTQSQQELQMKINKKQVKMVKCPHCSLENDQSNAECVFCEQSMIQIKQQPLIPIRRRAASRGKRAPKKINNRYNYKQCKYCHMNVQQSMLQSHQASCVSISGPALQQKYLLVQKNWCPFCYSKIPSSKFQDHEQICTNRKQFFNMQTSTYQRCSKLQKQTMIYMHKQSQLKHWIAEQSILKRIKALGYNAEDLENLHHYIVNYAPIIIHMHVNSHMQFFVKDTHYRNQFETMKSSGSLSSSSRTNWQDRMFDKKHHNATPFQRVKYGTINFTNDPKGVRACAGYGQSYFLLKSHVRNRCTVTDMDSSSPSSTIATFQFCYHLLSKLPDAQLRAAFEGSKATQVQSGVIGTYKEIQIHGPVEFKYDIERVYVNSAELTDPSFLEMVKQFCKKNDLQYEVFGIPPPKPIMPISGFGGFGGSVFPPVTGISSFMGSSLGFGTSSAVFSPPIMSPSTAHLFAPRRSREKARKKPSTSVFYSFPAYVPPTDEKVPKKEGVDYI